MSTGYTYGVQTGEVADFRTFALRCARSRGACIMQRDDPMDDPPKHREVSEYDQQAIARARADVAKWAETTEAEAEVLAAAAYEKTETDRLKRLEEIRAENARYQSMLAAVEQWTPPTPDHQGLKEFMADQLRESMEFDDVGSFYGKPTEKLSGRAWLSTQREQAARDVAYHEKSLREDEARCAETNAWIDALYASLGTG